MVDEVGEREKIKQRFVCCKSRSKGKSVSPIGKEKCKSKSDRTHLYSGELHRRLMKQEKDTNQQFLIVVNPTEKRKVQAI